MLKSFLGNIRHELFREPRLQQGRILLFISFVSGLAWLFMLYVQPGGSWFNGPLIMMVTFALLGTAECLPRRLLGLAVALRLTVLVLAASVIAWVAASHLA